MTDPVSKSLHAPEDAAASSSSDLPPWHPRRLPMRVAGAGALLLTSVIALFTWITVQDEQAMGQLSAERQIQAIAQNLAAASAAPLAEQGYGEIDRIARRMLAFADVQRISVVDDAGHVLIDLQRGPSGTPTLPISSADIKPPARMTSLQQIDDVLLLWLPIEEDRLLGWVRVEQSLAQVHAVSRRIVRDVALLGIGAVILSALLFVYYVRRAMQGIEQATLFAATLDQQRGAQLPTTAGPFEVQALEQALNHVSVRLLDQEHALAASTRRLKAVLDNAAEGIFTADEAGVITEANSAAEGILGFGKNEMVGESLQRLLPDLGVDDERDGDPLPRMNDGRLVLRSNMLATRRDGGRIPVQLGLSEIRLDARRLYIGIVRDITEEKRLDEMKDSFIAQVSHELRTPLTSLNAALSLMRSEGEPGEIRRLVEIAHNSSARLTRLVTDILDYERLEAGDLPLHIDVNDLAPVVEKAIEQGRARADALGISLVCGIPLPDARVLADPERLSQAIYKLVDNAVRMSPRGERVVVSVERRKNMIQIGVTDYGPGVPESFRNQVFSKFAQVESSDERYRTGAGLGLSLARAIIERHGGNIDFYSVPGVETKFFIEIPEVYDDPDNTD